MKKNNIIVIFSSHQKEETNNKFIKHISDTIGCKHEIICYSNYNEYSLTEIYNKGYSQNCNNEAIYVFCHNDILFKTKNWGKLLLTKFNSTRYDILGVAGTTYLADNGVWWTDRSKMVGVVEHTDGYNTWVNEYSKPIKGRIEPVVIVDGLFIAVNYDRIENNWDEDFKGFHFYDLNFSLDAYLNGNDIGVTTDIRILHKSIGMTNEQWELNRQQFVEKYKNELPITYEA